MVDRGEIPLMSAYMLSQVLSAYQLRFVDLAKTAPVHVFKATVAVFVKKQREAARQGKLDAIFNDEFTPVAYLRGLRELLAEKKQPRTGRCCWQPPMRGRRSTAGISAWTGSRFSTPKALKSSNSGSVTECERTFPRRPNHVTPSPTIPRPFSFLSSLFLLFLSFHL